MEITPEIDRALRAAHLRSVTVVAIPLMPVPTQPMPPYHFQKLDHGGGWATSEGHGGMYRHGEKR